jgi:hypothetical protein
MCDLNHIMVEIEERGMVFRQIQKKGWICRVGVELNKEG